MSDTPGLSELWIRVSRVCETCTLCVEGVATPPGWKAIVHSKTEPATRVEAVADHVLEAMDRVVALAEARGIAG